MPWIRFFPSDWLAGTRGMSAVETGVYITLIATMYERGEPIPEDHGRLARLCGSSNSAFAKAIETLIDEGKITRVDGGLWNDRVEKEQVYLSEKSEVARRAGIISAEKRKQNQSGEATDVQRTLNERSTNQKPEARVVKEEPTGSSKKRGTRLSDDWTPDIAFAVSVGLSQAQALTEEQKFREWWPAQPGQKGVKLDWDLTWKTWCRKAVERLPRQNGHGPPRPQSPSMQRHHEIHSRLKRELYGEPDDEFAVTTVDLAAGDFRSH
nr:MULTISPECIES: YdaU family protein [Sinorhizobium]